MRTLIVVFALVVLFTASVATGTETENADVSSSGVSVADAMAFREEFGFKSDFGTVTAMLKDARSDYTYGAPLSAAELANMLERLDQREDANALVAHIDANSPEFGGLYFTQGNGRLELTILETPSTTPEGRARAEALTPPRLPVSVQVVDHTWAELVAAQAAVDANRESLGVNTTWLDVRANKVVAVIDPGFPAAAVQEVAPIVPIEVRQGAGLAPAACTSRIACTPYRGGIKVSHPNVPTCTWSYYATRGTAPKYVVTAGHCGKIGQLVRHNGVVVSTSLGVDRNVYDTTWSASNSDSETAHVAGSPNAVSPFNTIWVSSTDKSHPITSTRSNSNHHFGDQVCFSGVFTGTTLCGFIDVEVVNGTVQRFDGRSMFLVNQVQMTRSGGSGDSGAPVYLAATAFGLASTVNGASNPPNKIVYSKIGSVMSDMQAQICLTSGC
jgi:hypothetical protein